MRDPAQIETSIVLDPRLPGDGDLAANGHPFELSCLWQGLCCGSYRVRDHFSSPDRHYALAEWLGPTPRDLPFAERRLAALRRVLAGQPQKEVAYVEKLGSATVATDLQRVLDYMGFVLPPSRVPLILAMASHASSCTSHRFDARCTELIADSDTFHVISTERPENRLAEQLSPTELAVLKLFVEGRSYGEIATLRQTSVRTVANQLASIYDRLEVSGRGELLHYITVCSASREPRTRPRRAVVLREDRGADTLA